MEFLREKGLYVSTFSRQISRRSVCELPMSTPGGGEWRPLTKLQMASAPPCAEKHVWVSKCPAFACVWRFKRNGLYNTYGRHITSHLALTWPV